MEGKGDYVSFITKDPVSCPSYLQSAISAAKSAGAIVVVSAGNQNTAADRYAPGNCKDVVVVAGHDGMGAKAEFSNFGSGVTLSAPATSIRVRDNDRNYGRNWEKGVFRTVTEYGTSFAAPLVSATLGRMFGNNPLLTVDKAISILKQTARPLNRSCDGGCGAGMLDAAAAIKAALPPPYATSVVISPSGQNQKLGTCMYYEATVRDQREEVMSGTLVQWSVTRNLMAWGSSEPNMNYICANAVGMGTITAAVPNTNVSGRAVVGVAP